MLFFYDTATTEIYTLSLHDALPILIDHAKTVSIAILSNAHGPGSFLDCSNQGNSRGQDRKSTRLNSSHGYISYAVFCLKKKKKQIARSNLYRSQRSFFPKLK